MSIVTERHTEEAWQSSTSERGVHERESFAGAYGAGTD